MARTNPAPLKTARWAEVRAFVAHRASFRCEHCHQFLGMSGQADHVIPRRDIALLGVGVFDPSNLQYLCTSCHSEKSNRERWQGHEKKPPKPHTRTRVPGRDDFLNAVGIPQPERNTSC
jgi:5-methylcytosine-specific restriction endonuclease McrA